VTTKYLYTNVALNLSHHINYVAALPCKMHSAGKLVEKWRQNEFIRFIVVICIFALLWSEALLYSYLHLFTFTNN